MRYGNNDMGTKVLYCCAMQISELPMTHVTRCTLRLAETSYIYKNSGADFTYTLLPTEIYMPCALHQLVNPLLFIYLAF